MKDLIPLALAVIGFLITLTPNQLGAKLQPWTPWITGAATLMVCWLLIRAGMYWARRRDARAARVAAFVVITKTVHDTLVSWRRVDALQLDDKLQRLERSEDAIWMEDDARLARADFIYHARDALDVRRRHEDYRNLIERSGHVEYLNNTRDRLVAALLKKRMPAMFNPYDDYDEPSLRERFRRIKRRIVKKLHPAKEAADG